MHPRSYVRCRTLNLFSRGSNLIRGLFFSCRFMRLYVWNALSFSCLFSRGSCGLWLSYSVFVRAAIRLGQDNHETHEPHEKDAIADLGCGISFVFLVSVVRIPLSLRVVSCGSCVSWLSSSCFLRAAIRPVKTIRNTRTRLVNLGVNHETHQTHERIQPTPTRTNEHRFNYPQASPTSPAAPTLLSKKAA